VSSQTASGYSETQGSVSMFLALDKSGSMDDDLDGQCIKADCNQRLRLRQLQWLRLWHGSWVKTDLQQDETNYYSKIEALKIAVGSLTAQLETADPTHIYARTGAVSYDINEYAPSKLAWGTGAVTSYVNALQANGGTNSSDAMDTAYTSLTAKNALETTARTPSTRTRPARHRRSISSS
jgi:hypothetical protein